MRPSLRWTMLGWLTLSTGCLPAAAEVREDHCQRLSFLVAQPVWAGYFDTEQAAPPQDRATAVLAEIPTEMSTPSARELWLEVWPGQGAPAAPAALSFSPGDSYQQCSVCMGFSTGCNAQLEECTARYLAVAGELTLEKLDARSDSGALLVTGKNLIFQEWDFNVDLPKEEGACVALSEARFDSTW